MGCPWGVPGVSVGSPWGVRVLFVGCPWVVRGAPMGRPCAAGGSRVDRQWVTHGYCASWDAHGQVLTLVEFCTWCRSCFALFMRNP